MEIVPQDITSDFLPKKSKPKGLGSLSEAFNFSKGKKRKTPRPIPSYGIILFCYDGGIPKYLIYQRRDNYEYIDIVRGNWNTMARLRELFAALSVEEKSRIKTHTFRELWDDLWVKHGTNIHLEGFEKARKKFESFSDNLDDILNSKDEVNLPNEPQWGFPKGKKNYGPDKKETDQECALREFGEETRLSTENLVLWGARSNPRMYTEFYKGNNGKQYCTYYFLAETLEMESITRIKTPGCIREDSVSDEAADARWLTFEEACGKLIPRRQSILKKVHHLIETSYESYTPFSSDKS